MPCAHLPFIAPSHRRHAPRLGTRPSTASRSARPATGGARTDVVDPDHARALASMAQVAVASEPASRSSTGRGLAARGAARPGAPGSPCGWCRPAPGSPSATSSGEVAQQGQVVGRRSCRSRCRGRPRPRRTPASSGRRGPLGQEGRAPRRPRRRSGGRPAWCAGVALHVHGHPADAELGGHRPQRGRDVVDQRGPGRHRGLGHRRLDGVDRHPDVRRPAPRPPGPPGAAPRRSDTGSAPGRVDSPPTSTTSAPSAIMLEAVGDGRVRGRGSGRRRRTSPASR